MMIPNLSFVLGLDPVVGIITTIVMGVAFAIVVMLRLKYQYSVINELKEAIDKANERISEIHTENEVNKTNIEWLTWLTKEEIPINKTGD
jgi:hypothetical protein